MTENNFTRRVDTAQRLAELRNGSKPQVEADTTPSEERDAEAFSLISADRQQKLMLELRLRSGNAKALAYSYLVAVDYDKSGGITMDFSGWDVTLGGKNLESLFSGLVAQRVSVVSELDDLHAEALLPIDATVVTRIDIRSRR